MQGDIEAEFVEFRLSSQDRVDHRRFDPGRQHFDNEAAPQFDGSPACRRTNRAAATMARWSWSGNAP
jgi:hypothetical protein